MQTFTLKSFDETEIFCTLWDDVESPKGVVQLVHGMSEYAGRYQEVAEYLNSRGYIVFADDHRAHGRTETDANRGRHKGNIFKKTLQDELFFREWLKQKYDLPVFLLGHSYGSFLSQAFAQAGTDVRAIALVGSGHMRDLFNLGKICVFPIFLVARNWRPKMVNWMSDNFFKFKGDEGKGQWINSLPERRATFVADPYCHTDMSVGFDFFMMSETSKLYRRKNLAKLDPTTAIAMFSGTDDMVGNNSKGVKKLDKMYRSLGIPTELNLYEGSRHEVLLDKSAKQCQQDVADFFDKFIVYEQTSLDDLIKE
ncbi:MAG: alpha/beta hydrolase [Clostridia bacterium]|nr:alpha/beta hydrolase [Clostridia bacterium]